MQLHATKYESAQSLIQNPPIIILHGLFGSSRNWHPIAQALSVKNTVYTLDLRNHGKSPHDELMDYPHMAQDVLTFLENVIGQGQLVPVTIIAHSMGGKAAMWLALSRPEWIHKLVVVDIAPVNYEHDFSDVLNALQAIPLELIKSRRDADQYLSKYISQSSLRQFLLQNLQSRNGKYRWRLNLEAISHAISEITGFPDSNGLEPFSERVLFIGGGQSDYLKKDYQKLTRQLFPLASFSMIKSAGHWLHAEQPQLFQALISPYLE